MTLSAAVFAYLVSCVTASDTESLFLDTCPLREDLLEDCQDLTSMVQVSMQLDSRGMVERQTHRESKAFLEYLLKREMEFYLQYPPPAMAPNGHWEGELATNKSHCLAFETSTASNGLPVCVEALMFGLLAAITYPIGAGLGVLFHPVSTWTTARWMALGAGALVFSVATQIYGNALFALLAVSRKYGPFDKGCKIEHGIDVCDEKFWNMIVTTLSGLAGAYIYVFLNRRLQQWARSDKVWRNCGGIAETGVDTSTIADSVAPSVIDETPDPSVMDPDTDSDSDPGTIIHGVPATPRIHPVVNSNVAFSIWIGCLLDAVPSAIMLGLLTNRHQVSFGFLFSLALANYPQAFAGASILLLNEMSYTTVMLLWTSIFMITGMLSLIASFFFPETCAGETFSVSALYGTAVAEGVTGGLMLAMLATAMLPAAYKGARHAAGIYFVVGFMTAILAETFNAYLAGPQQLLHNGKDHELLWGFGR